MHPSPLFNAASLRAFVGQSRGWLFSVAAGSCAVVVAALVLVGWRFDLDALKSMLSGTATMKPNAAACLALLGAALVLSSSCWSRSSRLVRTAFDIALLSSAILLLDARGGIRRRVSQWLMVGAMLVPTVAILGYPGSIGYIRRIASEYSQHGARRWTAAATFARSFASVVTTGSIIGSTPARCACWTTKAAS